MIGNFFFFFLVVVADGWIFFWLRFFVFVLWPLVVLTVVGSEFAIVYVVFTLCVREKKKKNLKFGIGKRENMCYE